MAEAQTGELQGREYTARLSANAPTFGRLHWDVVPAPFTPPDYDSSVIPPYSISTFGQWDEIGQRYHEVSEATSSHAVNDLRAIRAPQSMSECHVGSLYSARPASESVSRDVEASPDSNSECRDNHLSHSYFEDDSLTAATDDFPTLLLQVTRCPKREQRTERIFTCDKDSPLHIGGNNRPAREMVEEACRTSLLIPNGRKRLLRLVEAFEETYKIRRIARGVPDAAKRRAQRQVFREGLVRLLFTLTNTERRDLRLGNPLKRIAKLERKARALGVL